MPYTNGTKLTNLIVPEIFSAYFVEQVVAQNQFFNSGIVAPSPQLTEMMRMGGYTGNLPFFQDITGDAEVLSEYGALSMEGITASKEVYAVLARGKAWTSNDLAEAFTATDPLSVIASKVSNFWERELNKTLIASLNGLFSGDGMSGLVSDITGESGDAAKIGSSTIVDALQKLGDASDKVTAIAMHSASFAKLVKDQLIDYVRDAQFDITFPTYLGKRVIVSDNMPSDGYGNYTTYLFTPNSVVYGGNVAKNPTEVDRDILSGADILATRYHFTLHPRGTAINVSGISGATPSNAELAGDIWTRVYELKNMGIVQMKHKI